MSSWKHTNLHTVERTRNFPFVVGKNSFQTLSMRTRYKPSTEGSLYPSEYVFTVHHDNHM